MHSSLRVLNNRMLLVVWICGVAVLLIAAPTPLTIPVLLVALPSGIAAGVLQRVAIAANRAAFVSSVTAFDVRRALTGCRAGNAAIILQWLAFAAILILTVRDPATLPAAFLGVVAFWLARDVTTYPAVVRLEQSVSIAAIE